MLSRLKALELVGLILAMILSLLIGYVDSHSDEVQPAVILLVGCSCLFSFVWPRRPWLWPMIFGLGILVSYLIRRALGFVPLIPPQPNVFATLLALIPALIGTYIGYGLRQAASRVQS